MRLYAEISKTEEVADGTIKVWGYASSGAEDADGEVITPAAMKAAIGDYMKFGAVREMHQPIAAGTAIEMSVEDDGRTFFGAHVVDPIAVTKVRSKVYKGFSVGGNITLRDKVNKNTITGIKLIEVSLVDRPANPEAVFTMYKSELEGKDAINAIAALLDTQKFTPGQLLKQAQILAEPVIEKAKAGTLKKGMYALSNFAQVLSAVACMASDSECEASWEQDSSPVPQQLRDWLSTGVQIFETMTTEECDEMMAELKPIAMAAQAAMTKAAEAAAATATTTKADEPAAVVVEPAAATAIVDPPVTEPVVKVVTSAIDAPVTTAAAVVDATQAVGTAATTGTEPAAVVAKVDAPVLDDLVKTELAKRDDQITKLLASIDTLKAQVDRLNAQPAPGKAFLKAVGKGDDVDGAAAAAAADPTAPANMVKSDDPLTVMKGVHATGGRRLFDFRTAS